VGRPHPVGAWLNPTTTHRPAGRELRASGAWRHLAVRLIMSKDLFGNATRRLACPRRDLPDGDTTAMDLNVEVDAGLQAEDVQAVLHGDQLTVVVSPDVTPASLAFLSSDVALAVADAVDQETGNEAERP
jgi:hypothetical protein